MQELKNLWENYKKLKWYWKLLTAVPFIILIMFFLVSFSWTSIFHKKALRKHFDETKNESKKILEEVEKEEKERKKIDRELKKLTTIEEKIEINLDETEDTYDQIIKDIDSADGDIDKLDNILTRIDSKYNDKS